MLRDAKRDLNRALKHSPKDYQVMYFRGILNFALHYFYDAITDFEIVIEKSEDTSAKFYLARGRCYACLSLFKEAITDLSISINLNKDLLDVFISIILILTISHKFITIRFDKSGLKYSKVLDQCKHFHIKSILCFQIVYIY